jgi:hypothetical protein
MDGDGQHDPAAIPNFIEKMDASGADIIVGSRILGADYKDAPLFRRKFLPFYTGIINSLTGYHLTDSMCGFRAFKVSSLIKAAPILNEMLEPQYLAAEMFIRFAKAGLTVEEIPISLGSRLSGVSTKGFIRYGFGVLKAIMKTFLDKNYRRLESRR